MATSPIYGWAEPDDTSLVKNGALAMRTLGNAIDTTMATMTPKSIVDAKGDLIGATANDTPARLAVGNNGETLLADSTTSTGLRYQSAYNGNQIINGGFDNWQRNTSFTAGAVYSADRWYLNAVAGTTTVSRDTDVPTGLAGQYSIKQLTAAGSSFAQWSTPLETATVVPLQGKAVVLSYYMKKNATWSNNFGPNVYYSNSTDALASQTTAVTIVNVVEPLPTTSWTRFYTTFTVPSDAKGLLIQFNPSVVQASGASLNMAGVQLEIGSVPTLFKRAGGTVQGELAACQRYYQRWNGNSTTTGIGMGIGQNTSNSQMEIRHKTTMRVAPTAVERSGGNVTDHFSYTVAISSLSFVAATEDSTYFIATTAAGLIISAPNFYQPSSGYFAVSAEL